MLLSALPEFLRSLTPDAAVILGTLGLGLGCFEFNRPGRVLPGAIGLLLLLLACAALSCDPLRATAVLGLLSAMLALLLNAWQRIPGWALAGAILAIAVSLRFLVLAPDAARVHTPVAAFCGLGAGTLSAALTRVAYRARRSKALN